MAIPFHVMQQQMRNGGNGGGVSTLAEAINEPCANRDKERASQPMPNFRSTPGNRHNMPLAFWSAWTLTSRPRRIALLVDDAQEEYRPYAEPIIPNLVKLTQAFRARGAPIMWSAWSRHYKDGISNAMDRWYGPDGLRVHEPENACYIFDGDAGMRPLKEIAPTADELAAGCFYHSHMLDMFWEFRPDGKSYLDEKLKDAGIDTVVICGLWTDECILATSYAALSRGYDVVVARDAVGTATAHQESALTIIGGTCGVVLRTDEITKYMHVDFVEGLKRAVKGLMNPDGRKDNT